MHLVDEVYCRKKNRFRALIRERQSNIAIILAYRIIVLYTTTPAANCIALLTGKQIFVLTIAEKFA